MGFSSEIEELRQTIATYPPLRRRAGLQMVRLLVMVRLSIGRTSYLLFGDIMEEPKLMTAEEMRDWQEDALFYARMTAWNETTAFMNGLNPPPPKPKPTFPRYRMTRWQMIYAWAAGALGTLVSVWWYRQHGEISHITLIPVVMFAWALGYHYEVRRCRKLKRGKRSPLDYRTRR